MSYRSGWLLVLGAGVVSTLLAATMVGVGLAVSNRAGRVAIGIVGVVVALGLVRAYASLWRVRPSTRPNRVD